MDPEGIGSEPRHDHAGGGIGGAAGNDNEADSTHSTPDHDHAGGSGAHGSEDEPEADKVFGGWFDVSVGVVVIVNIAVIIMDVDSRSLCDDGEACTEVSKLTELLNKVFLAIYSVELLGRLFVQRWAYFTNKLNLLDLCVVLVGVFDLFGSKLPNLQMLRVFRILRISRIALLLRSFPMLLQLVRGVRAAIIATFWGYLLIVTFLMIWSLIAVEVIQPVNRTLDHSDDWCGDAFESVVRASLYFFQTLIAGDSWGACAIPIMHAAPYTYFVFVGTQVSVQIGILNLVLAIIVDAASSSNAANEEEVIQDKAARTRTFTSKLKDALEKADVDKSGTISWDEMVAGYRTEPDVRKTFKILDIEEQDLARFFSLSSEGGGGEQGFSYAHFVGELQKAQLQDPRIYMMMMKLQIQRITELLQEMTVQPGERAPCLRSNPMATPSSAPRSPSIAPAPSHGHGQPDASLHSGPDLDLIWRSLESQIESRLKEMAKEVVDYAAGVSTQPSTCAFGNAPSKRAAAPLRPGARESEPRDLHNLEKPGCSAEENRPFPRLFGL